MAISEKLEFLLSADPTQAVGAFQKVGEASSKALGSAETNAAKVGSSLTKIGAGGIGVGGLLTAIGSKDQEAAGQLKAAIDNVGQSYSDFGDRIDKTVESQVKFGNTDDDVKNALATLTLATGDTSKALDLMQVTTDLAARKHESLGEAASSIGKIFNGSTRPLKEFGIQVGLNADGTKNYAAAVEELGQKLQGQAAAGADTATGKFKALKAEAENFFSELGQKFGPAILAASTVATALGAAISALTAIQAKRAAATTADVAATKAQAAADAEAAAAEGSLATATEGSTAAMTVQAGATTEAGLSMGAFAAGSVLTLGALADLALALKLGTDLWKDWNGGGVGAVDAVHGAVLKLADNHDLKTFDNDVADSIGALVENGHGIDTFSDAATKLFDDTLKTKGKDAAATLIGSFTNLSREGILPADYDTGALWTKINQFSDTSALDAQTQSAKQLDQAAKDAQKDFENLKQAQEKLLPAELRVAGSEDRIAAANAKVADTKSKLGSGKDAAENAQLQRDYNDAVRAAEQAVNDAAQASADLAEQQDKANGVTHDASYYVDIYKANLQTLANSMSSGDVHTGLEQYITDLNNTEAAALNAAHASLEASAAAGDRQSQNILGHEAQKNSGDYAVAGARASGGPVGPGTWLVGEHGPELMRLGAGASGYVYDAGQTADMNSGTSSFSPTVHNYFNGDISPRKAADEQFLALRRLSLVG